MEVDRGDLNPPPRGDITQSSSLFSLNSSVRQLACALLERPGAQALNTYSYLCEL